VQANAGVKAKQTNKHMKTVANETNRREEHSVSLKKFIDKKETHLQQLEQQRKARMRASRAAAWEMSLAA